MSDNNSQPPAAGPDASSASDTQEASAAFSHPVFPKDAKLSEQLPPDAMVLQLPYLAFPEGLTATGQLTSEVEIRYLQTEGVRWSGGGIKGRPTADWPGVLETYQPGQIARLAAAAGFAGVLVDRSGLTASDDRRLALGLLEATGSQPLTGGQDARWAFYPLDTVRADLDREFSADELAAIANQVVDPVTVTIEPSFSSGLVDGVVVHQAATLEPFVGFAHVSTAADGFSERGGAARFGAAPLTAGGPGAAPIAS